MIRLQKRDLSYTMLNRANFNEFLELSDVGGNYIQLLYSRDGVEEFIDLIYENYVALEGVLNAI